MSFNLRNIRISVKIPIALTIFVLLPITIVIIALTATNRVNKGGQEIYDNYFVSVKNLTDARRASYNQYVWLKSHIISPDDESMLMAEQQISDANAILNLSLERFEKTLDPGLETNIFSQVTRKLDDIARYRSEILALSRVNRDDEADDITNSSYHPLFLEIQNDIQAMLQTNIDGAELFYQQNEITAEKLERQLIVVSLAIFLIAIVISWLLITSIQKPITKVQQAINSIASDQNLKTRLPIEGKDEIAELSLAFNNLTETLEGAQGQLLQSEKLASLGSLVAGVSHEINTPLGIAVTMGSTFERDMKQFIRQLREGKARKSELDEFESNANEGLRILLSALEQASTLIHNFKRVAVDQTSEERRAFNLKEVVEENISTLLHQIKHTNIKVEMELDPSLQMDSYPGPMGQVITNLFNNAILHGFDGLNDGLIKITTRESSENIILRFVDTGLGIPEDIINRVFDPFVSTKMGQGGSGLGLNIVFNIVTGVLGGQMSVQMTEQKETEFTIVLPKLAPQ